jgi:hypothetical protein
LLEIQQRLFGPKDSTTLTTMQSLAGTEEGQLDAAEAHLRTLIFAR